jgi:hypothetical protein
MCLTNSTWTARIARRRILAKVPELADRTAWVLEAVEVS